MQYLAPQCRALCYGGSLFDQIRNDGHVHRGQVGIRAQSLSPALAQGLGLPRDNGVLVGDVTPDGPADGTPAAGPTTSTP